MRIGVVIGRFQVPELHPGHDHLLGHVAGVSDKLVVFIGVSPIDGESAEFALTYSQRQSVFARSKYKDAITLPLFDMPSSKDWSLQIDALLMQLYPREHVTLYGGRDSFAQEYSGAFPVTTVPVNHALSIIQGRDIRESLIEESSEEFLRGQIRALQRLFPTAYHTVDVAALNDKEELLLIQRKDNNEWGMVGGFVDPTDDSAEHAAVRELSEETGLGFASGARSSMQYVGSHRINDWRFRGSRNKIISSFFLCRPMTTGVRPNYDEVQDYKWVPVSDPATRVLIADVHKPLLDDLLNYLDSHKETK